MVNSNIESVREWLRTCDKLSTSKFMRVDYIDDDPNCYAVYSSPSALKYGVDILGNSYLEDVQQAIYYFAINCPYGKDISQNMANIAELESVIEWINAQNIARNFPTLKEGKVISILPTLSPVPMPKSVETAVYQITISMTYRR